MKKEERPKTAMNAISTYARAMDLMLRELNWETVLCFLDGILVMGKDFEDHMRNRRVVSVRNKADKID